MCSCLIYISTFLPTQSILHCLQLLADMNRTQKRVKMELQESTRDFQRQLSELSVRIKALQLKEEWLLAEHLKEDSSDVVLVEHVDAAKKR